MRRRASRLQHVLYGPNIRVGGFHCVSLEKEAVWEADVLLAVVCARVLPVYWLVWSVCWGGSDGNTSIDCVLPSPPPGNMICHITTLCTVCFSVCVCVVVITPRVPSAIVMLFVAISVWFPRDKREELGIYWCVCMCVGVCVCLCESPVTANTISASVQANY